MGITERDSAPRFLGSQDSADQLLVSLPDGQLLTPSTAPLATTVAEAVTQVIVDPSVAVVQESAGTGQQVIAAGFRGPAGPPGTMGDSDLDVVAGTVLGGHRVVYYDGLVVRYADHVDEANADKVLGITTQAAEQGGVIRVKRQGLLVESTWSWNPGPVFLGSNGLLTQASPVTGFILQVGVAMNATTLDIRPTFPIYLS